MNNILSLSQGNYQGFGVDDQYEQVNATQFDDEAMEYNMVLGGPSDTHVDYVAHTNVVNGFHSVRRNSDPLKFPTQVSQHQG